MFMLSLGFLSFDQVLVYISCRLRCLWFSKENQSKQFQKVMKEVLQEMGMRFEGDNDVLKQGKIIRTPYGGRLEYLIAGYPFVIHLKNAELVQRSGSKRHVRLCISYRL